MLVKYMPLTVPDPDQHFKAVLAAEPVPVLPIGLAGNSGPVCDQKLFAGFETLGTTSQTWKLEVAVGRW
jgi:hypothetical protein